jgi:hypothetical protein
VAGGVVPAGSAAGIAGVLALQVMSQLHPSFMKETTDGDSIIAVPAAVTAFVSTCVTVGSAANASM